MGAAAIGTPEYERAMKAYNDGGEILIEDLRDMLKAMMGRDARVGDVHRLEGHNTLSFDIDKLMGTIKAQSVYQNQSTEAAVELKQLWRDFRNKRFGSLGVRDMNYAQDTLDTAKYAMQLQRNIIGEQIDIATGSSDLLAGLTETARRSVMDEVRTHLLGEFTVSPQLGGFKGADSLENLFLNTNFLELLEGEKSIGSVLAALERGGEHTADVDAMLNAYLSEYINNDLLKIRRLPTAGQSFDSLSPQAAELLKQKSVEIQDRLIETGHMSKAGYKYSQFAEYMRARIARSSSVTPVTNVGDVSGLSDELFGYLSENVEGRRKMTVSVTLDELINELRSGLNRLRKSSCSICAQRWFYCWNN